MNHMKVSESDVSLNYIHKSQIQTLNMIETCKTRTWHVTKQQNPGEWNRYSCQKLNKILKGKTDKFLDKPTSKDPDGETFPKFTVFVFL